MKKILLIAVIFLYGCQIKNGTVKVRSYVDAYYEIKGIELSIRNQDWQADIRYDIFITPVTGDSYWSKSTGRNWEIYEELCRKHSDMSYNKKIPVVGQIFPQFLDRDFTDIIIKSDSDFDENHPPGSRLNDIITFNSLSPIKFIESGYKTTFQWTGSEEFEIMEKWFHMHQEHDKSHYYPIIKNGEDLSTESLKLLGPGNIRKPMAVIEFTHLPTLSNRHNFTVEMVADDGTRFSDTIEMIFE